MNYSNQSCNEKVVCLKRQLENLSKLEWIQRFTKENIEEAEKEREQLRVLKNTLTFLKSRRLLAVVDKEDIWGENEARHAQRIPAQTERFLKNGKRIKSTTTSVTTAILIAMCAVMIFLMLYPWIEINGVLVSLYRLWRDHLLQNPFFSRAMTYAPEIMPFLIIAGLSFLGVCAAVYVFFIIRVCHRKETNAPYAAMLCVIVAFIFFIGVTQTIVFYTERAAGNVFFMRTGMTIQSWAALFLSCTLGIGYYKRRRLALLFDRKDIVWEEVTRIYPVTNYYPWRNIRFLSLVIKQSEDISFSIKYIMRKEGRNTGIEEDNDIVANLSVLIKTEENDYMISRCEFNIDQMDGVRETNELFVEGTPFHVDDIIDVKIILHSLGDSESACLLEPLVYAESGMDSFELGQYRSRVGADAAVCRAGEAGRGWLCSCGLYHQDSEKQCGHCFEYKGFWY